MLHTNLFALELFSCVLILRKPPPPPPPPPQELKNENRKCCAIALIGAQLGECVCVCAMRSSIRLRWFVFSFFLFARPPTLDAHARWSIDSRASVDHAHGLEIAQAKTHTHKLIGSAR